MYTLIYDGDCRMCTRLVDALRVWDRGRLIETVPSQVVEVRARFFWIPAQAYSDAIQLVGPKGETWQGSAAVEQVLSVLPRGRWIAWAFHIPFMRGLADRMYRWVARNRYRIGCSDHCPREPRA